MAAASARETAFAAFLREAPAYRDTLPLDSLRTEEFGRLDEQRAVYLDYTGAGLYAKSQVEKHQRWLLDGVYGNPHSTNPPSILSTEQEAAARRAVLRFFGATNDEYQVIWTSNASGALHVLGESFPFDKRATLLLSADNHNSVNGLREVGLPGPLELYMT